MMRTYKRKTVDEYQIHQYFYPTGWEEVHCETTWAGAKASLQDYRNSDPTARVKIVIKRVPIEEGAA